MQTLNDKYLGKYNTDETFTPEFVMKKLNKALGKRLNKKYEQTLEKYDPMAYKQKEIVEFCLCQIPGWDDLTEQQANAAVHLTKEWVALASKRYVAKFRSAFNVALMSAGTRRKR